MKLITNLTARDVRLIAVESTEFPLVCAYSAQTGGKKNASKVGCHLALDRDHTAEDVSTVGRITGEDANNFQPLNRILQWWKTVFRPSGNPAL